MDDIPFIDELQKKNNKSLGFMPRMALEGKIRREEILIAEEVVCRESLIVSRAEDSDATRLTTNDQRLTNPNQRLTTDDQRLTKVGYLIGNDRYYKRDELGAIFQLCVVPGKRRGLVGATLLKSLFERASYGTTLYCCWCAQDLEANHFWEAMGFVPVAFRSGAKKKVKDKDGNLVDRVHIFWQKRIRAGDTTTPYWYPHQTGGGAIGEDRIVLPIPPNVHWSEVKSVVVPGSEVVSSELPVVSTDADASRGKSDSSLTTHYSPLTTEPTKRTSKSTQHSALSTQNSKKQPYTIRCGSAIYFAPAVVEKPKVEKVKKEKAAKIKHKNDPTKVKAARKLRDMYMEEINRGEHLVSNGKYDVGRTVSENPLRLNHETSRPKLIDGVAA